VHKETLSPLDATLYVGKERPGMHPSALSVDGAPAAAGGAGAAAAGGAGASSAGGGEGLFRTARPDPKGELLGGGGGERGCQ
jgi:hypothetical protein